MAVQIFPQTTIAIIWDFDDTLIPGSMQSPIFEKYGINEQDFWYEVNNLGSYYSGKDTRINQSTAYLNHILTYVQYGRLPGLGNEELEKLGAKIELFDGVTELFQQLKEGKFFDERSKKHDIHVELYVVSSGLKRMIKGSKVAPYVDEIWGCEFIEAVSPPGYRDGAQAHLIPDEVKLSQVGYIIDDTTKTRAIFEINKGVNQYPSIEVNSQIPNEHRRVPFKNMIYVADGPSDIPVFSLLNQYGGRTYAVYRPGSKRHFDRVFQLGQQNRIQAFGPADYRAGTQTSMWILKTVEDIASRIVNEKESALQSAVQSPPGHVAAQENGNL